MNHPSTYGPSKHALLRKILETLSYTLWRIGRHITIQDRDWFLERVSQMFDARLKKAPPA